MLQSMMWRNEATYTALIVIDEWKRVREKTRKCENAKKEKNRAHAKIKK